ncbi:MAG: hypothetical protein PH343_10330, partial [Nitrospira sp.]|nr:hypothetical protein [Nitrospira sp.]
TLCFDTSLKHEISFNGRKLIGSAHRRWPDIFLQHGSILIDEGPDGNGINFISISKLRENHLKTMPDLKDIINAICAGFSESLNINLIEDELTSHEKGIAEKLLKEKYYLPSWNNRHI